MSNHLNADLKSSCSNQIIVTLDGEVRDLDSEVTSCGIVLPNDVLSEEQLSTLRDDVAQLRRTQYEMHHQHKSQLCLESEEEIKVLKLICGHVQSQKRVSHLEQFLIFRQHGIHVPEWLARESLSNSHQTPFMVKIGDNKSMSYFLGSFNYYICVHSINPHTWTNIYLLGKKHFNIKNNYDGILKIFIWMSQEEQEEVVYSYTSNQIEAVLDCDWYRSHESLRSLHLERVKKNLPILVYTFIIRLKSKTGAFNIYKTVRAMTSSEIHDYYAIMERTKFVVTDEMYIKSNNVFGSLVYWYLRLGSTDFEELLQYLQNHSRNQQGAIVSLLCNSLELQEMIVSISEENPQLPLSLKLELYDLDWDSYIG